MNATNEPAIAIDSVGVHVDDCADAMKDDKSAIDIAADIYGVPVAACHSNPQKLGLDKWSVEGDIKEDRNAQAHDETDRASQEREIKAAKLVSIVSIVVSVIAAAFGLGIGFSEETLSLIGFGVEAVLDGVSSALVLWRFKKPKSRNHQDQEAATQFEDARNAKRERNSSIGIGITFVASSVLLFFSAVYKAFIWDTNDLMHQQEEISGANYGLILSFPSAIAFGALAYWKLALAKNLGSQVLYKDGMCSLLGAVLGLICGLAAIVEEASGDAAGMAVVDAVASASIAFILLVEGCRTLQHNLGQQWNRNHIVFQ